jgi:hypothetical protein
LSLLKRDFLVSSVCFFKRNLCRSIQACTQAEVDEAYATAKVAHKQW